MNFIQARVDDRGAVLTLAGGGRLALDEGRLASRRGQALTLGIRPEHFSLSEEGSCRLELRADHVELLGADTLIHGHLDGDGAALTIRLPDIHPVAKNSRIRVSVSPLKIHLFDPLTGMRIEN